MKIVNKELRSRFTGRGYCELCKMFCSWRCGHHAFSKGSGGPDLAINLISLGDAFLDECCCHSKLHSGGISREEVLVIVARREETTVDAIVDVVNLIRHHLPKKPSKEQIRRAIAQLDEGSQRLANRELKATGVL